jgi:hypothetical protein
MVVVLTLSLPKGKDLAFDFAVALVFTSLNSKKTPSSRPELRKAQRSGGTCFPLLPQIVVILRSALWDPFGKAEWACATKDLLLPLHLLVIPTERSDEGPLRMPQISNQKTPTS